MKRKHYILSSGTRQAFLALFLSMITGLSFSQNTYTFSFTGAQQTINLQAGTYTIEAWGGDGGNNLGNGGTTLPQNGGKGGYSRGTFTLASPAIVYVNVGGKGANSTSALNTTVTGGYNGGGYGSLNTTSGKSSGAGGGGASHVAMAPGLLSALVSNTAAIRIVAGGGGGAGESNYASNNAQYNSNGGFGGGLSGLQNVSTGYQGRHGQGGTQTAGGGGGDNGSAVAGIPLQGIFGAGGFNPVSGANSSAGGAGIGGGGSGWYGGGAGWGGAATSFQAGSGGGGSSYIGGVSNATTIISGQPGFVTNPDLTGNGYVLIKEECSITLGTSNGNNLLCQGAAVTLTTNAISSYSWNTGSNASSITVSPSVTTSYTLTAMSPSMCMTSAAITISVSNAAPVLTVTASSPTVCLGNTVSITATGALSYSFSGGISNGVAFTPSATNTYTILGQNGCATASAVSTITLSALPVIALASPSVVCAGNTSTLSGGGANTYTWQPGNIVGSSILVSPQVSTTYTVTGTSGNCLGINTLVLNANPNPTLSVNATNSLICEGETVTLTASGALNYTWQPVNQTGSSIVVTPTAPIAYQVSGDNSFGCISTVQQPVVVFPAPVFNLTTPTPTICEGNSATLSVSGTNSYSWSTGATGNSISVTPAATSVYSVIGTNTTTQCSNTKTIQVTVFVSSISISSPTGICTGSSATLTANGATAYNWNTGANSSQIIVSPTGTSIYSVSGITSIGSGTCAGSASVQVAVNPLPTLNIVASNTITCINYSQSATFTVSGAQSYTWAFSSTGSVISVTPVTSGFITYSVVGTDQNGCANVKSITIRGMVCGGLNDNNETAQIHLEIFPNPSSGELNITAKESQDLILINELGQLIHEVHLNSANNYQFTLHGLAKGIYFIRSKEYSHTLSKKIVVLD